MKKPKQKPAYFFVDIKVKKALNERKIKTGQTKTHIVNEALKQYLNID